MWSEAVEGNSAETVLDACGESSSFLPATVTSRFNGGGSAAVDSGVGELETSSSFLDQHQRILFERRSSPSPAVTHLSRTPPLPVSRRTASVSVSSLQHHSVSVAFRHFHVSSATYSLAREENRPTRILPHGKKQYLHARERRQLAREGRRRRGGKQPIRLLPAGLLALQDLERQESNVESKLRISEEEQLDLSRSKFESIGLDRNLINLTNKLNSLKKELATKMKAVFSLRCQLDDVPVQTELIQYETRFSELYVQIQEKHHLTRRHYATYNALMEIKELMLKEVSLLNSINLQFKDAMTTPSGRSKLLDSLEVLVKGTKHKLEKTKLDLLAEQKVCDSLKEKHIVAVAEQRHFSSLLKTFQDACTEYERLRQLSYT